MAQFSTFFIPLNDSGEMQNLMNAFIRSKRILCVDKVFAGNGWSFCLEWLEGGVATHAADNRFGGHGRNVSKAELLKSLSPDHAAKFEKMREKRLKIANDDGLQAYEVMTDVQMIDLIKMEKPTLERIRKIPKYGDAKTDSFGERLIAAYAEIATPPEKEKTEKKNVVGNEVFEVKDK